MKKVICSVLVGIIVACALSSSKPAEAQTVIVSNRCCDANNIIRCIQVNYTPIGGNCFCAGQGWGWTC